MKHTAGTQTQDVSPTSTGSTQSGEASSSAACSLVAAAEQQQSSKAPGHVMTCDEAVAEAFATIEVDHQLAAMKQFLETRLEEVRRDVDG